MVENEKDYKSIYQTPQKVPKNNDGKVPGTFRAIKSKGRCHTIRAIIFKDLTLMSKKRV